MVLEIFGVNRVLVFSATVLMCLLLGGAVYYFIRSAPPRTITITSGPEGSLFQTNAIRYAEVLARHGVKLKVLTSHGSIENLQRLSDPSFNVDLGLVIAGVSNGPAPHLVSLGSISHQPILIFYHGPTVPLLSDFAGKRLAIGPPGSGTRALALTLLQANGISTNGPTQLLDWDPDKATSAFLNGSVDAIFLMGEAASSAIFRELLHTPGIQLYNFTESDAYTRRFNFLHVLELPRGVIDLGSNVPPQNIALVGPTVDLIARDTLHPALSDLILDAAREVNGRATLLQKKNEFPAPFEHDFPISSDASRFYKSGKQLFYRFLPFWLASLTSRVLVAFVPMLVLAIPVVKFIPAFYRWRVRVRIFRWYRALLSLEKRLLVEADPDKRAHLLQRLEEIEDNVNHMRVPTFFADQFYTLRSSIMLVRQAEERSSAANEQTTPGNLTNQKP